MELNFHQKEIVLVVGLRLILSRAKLTSDFDHSCISVDECVRRTSSPLIS